MKYFYLFCPVALVAISLATSAASDEGKLSAPLVREADSLTTLPPRDPVLPMAHPEEIVKDFKVKYVNAQKPRLILYINRELIQDRGEMLDLARVDRGTQVKGDVVTDANGVNVQIGQNSAPTTSSKSPAGVNGISPVTTGLGGERKESGSVSVRVVPDRQLGTSAITDYESRQIEEVFGDKFDQAGARWVDQKLAARLQKTFAVAGDRFLTAPETSAEKQEIDSLKNSADVVIEVLARKKQINTPTPAGDTTEERLELTATAMDLRQPGVVLARVSSDSLFGFNRRDGKSRERAARKVTSAEIIEQVSLALMDRMSF